MSTDLEKNARAVFLPAFAGLDVEDIMVPFLQAGGCSVLLGESRSEYVNRHMSAERLNVETPDIFRSAVDGLKAHCPNLIVAVDEELGGIRRLAGLTPPLPLPDQALGMSHEDLVSKCYETAKAARALGVNMFLAPIADVLNGRNPWLQGRTISDNDVEATAKVVSAFIEGVQKAGVCAVTKHFPGFNAMEKDPALEDVKLATSADVIARNGQTFKAAIAADTKCVMAGPAPVAAFDPENAACTSKVVLDMLRNEYGFKGIIVSDDLDAPATMRGQTLLETSIKSLNAGADLLLIAGGAHLNELCEGIVKAVRAGVVSESRLSDAANRVRHLMVG